MKLIDYRKEMLPAIEDVLQEQIALSGGIGTEELQAMLRYHLGWEGKGAGRKAQGKRIRPLLVLLSCAASEGNWHEALAAAASVELLHNFSLIHDDIQDNSSQRRGRPTLWTTWGIAQAINAGDAMFALAHSSLKGLSKFSEESYSRAIKVLPLSSLKLTQGQYMDLAFENKKTVSIDDYWIMVKGKTAVLIATCCELGAIAGKQDNQIIKHYRNFGEKVGLAFQVHDDILGIWGSEETIGKSNHSDLISGKKSLPVLFGLAAKGDFAKMWSTWNFSASKVYDMAKALENDGAKQLAEEKVLALTDEALASLEKAKPSKEAGTALKDLALELVDRSF